MDEKWQQRIAQIELRIFGLEIKMDQTNQKLSDIAELERRLAKMEKAFYMAFGALACLELILKFTK